MKNANVKTVTNKAVASTIPEFDSGALALIKAHELFDKASAKLTDTVDCVMNGYIDQCHKAGVGKTEAEVTRLGKTIRDSQAVLDIVALGAMEKKTFTEYAQSAMRAFYWGIPFEQGLKNKAEYILPWSKATPKDETTDNKKAGPSTETTLAAAHQTMAKALSQYRTMLQRDFVAELLDVIQARFPDFDETK